MPITLPQPFASTAPAFPPTPPPPMGFVSLVGAGPGHPELLTLRGLRRLEEAGVVLPDALLGAGFAELYPPWAVVLPVGRRCGGRGRPQEEVHALMIRHARAGARVVRLKNGDPLVFGRGFEEAEALAGAGIPFEVVPGVSALQAGAAAAGLSLTHRNLADEVRILQGHDLLERDRDWSQLAAPGPTLVLFMAVRTLPAIARRLLEAGAPRDLPVVLVEDVSGPAQATTRSILAHAASGRLRGHTGGPGIVYLGPAAGLRSLPRASSAFASALAPPTRALSEEGFSPAAGGDLRVPGCQGPSLEL